MHAVFLHDGIVFDEIEGATGADRGKHFEHRARNGLEVEIGQ